MKQTLLIACIAFMMFGSIRAADPLPRLDIHQKELIDQALAELLKHDPKLKSENLEITGLTYQYSPTEGHEIICGPRGCIWKPAAPFNESLSVTFRYKNSARKMVANGEAAILSDGISVTFPSPRMPRWFFGKVSYSQPIKEAEQDAVANP